MPLKNASKIGLSIACILCTPWIANAGIDTEWKIKNDEFTRKNNQCMDEFRSAQFNQAEKTRTSFNPSGVRRLDPSGGGNLSREYKKWAVNGRRVYWIAHKLGKCERGPVFTLDVERQEKCLDSSPYSMPEKDRWYDCIRLFKIEKDSIMNIPSLYEYKKSKRFGLSKVTQGVPINYEELVIDAYEKLELNKFNQVN